MGVKVEGLTATNLVNNGDFSDGATGWTQQGTTVEAVNGEANVTVTANFGTLACLFTPVANNVYYICADIKSSSSAIGIVLRGRPGCICYSIIVVVVTMKGCPCWNNGKHSESNRWFHNGVARSSVKTNLMRKNPLCINLTATFGAENEPTKEQCDAMFANWFDGTKSVSTPLRIKSVGRIYSTYPV